MKIFDGLVIISIIAIMISALASGAEIPMSVMFVFFSVGVMATIDYCDR